MGADDWHDPHGILPESFREQHADCETVADALRSVEAAPSTTSLGERPRCPECNSTHVSLKPGNLSDQPSRRDGAYKCGKSNCMAHFSDPVFNTVIPMNDPRARQFDWIDDDLAEPDERTPLDGALAGFADETLRGLAIALYQPWTDSGPSYRQLAHHFPYSRKWIGDQIRAWKAGEHREIVPDPTDVEPITADASSDTGAVATDGGRRSRWGAYGSD